MDRAFSKNTGNRRAGATLLLALLCLAACGNQAPALNSDRIDARYGSYAVRVLYQDYDWRLSSLESREPGGPVTRTLALVEYKERSAGRIAPLHERIRAGESIGSTFRSAGWTISKPTLFVGEIEIPASATLIGALMDIEVPARLAAHAYRFDIAKGTEQFTYATIIELHHADYLGVAALHKLYPAPDSSSAAARAIADAVNMLSDLPVSLARGRD